MEYMEEFSIIPSDELRGYKQVSHRRTAFQLATPVAEPFEILTRSELISAITPAM